MSNFSVSSSVSSSAGGGAAPTVHLSSTNSNGQSTEFTGQAQPGVTYSLTQPSNAQGTIQSFLNGG